MKKMRLAWLFVLCIILTGCGKAGPDMSALPTLETESADIKEQADGYNRNEPIVIYEETLSDNLIFSLYEDGRLIISGADITNSIVDTQAYRDYKDDITIIEIGEGVSLIGEKVFAKAEKVQKVLAENKAERHIRGGMATKRKYLERTLKNRQKTFK